MINPYAERIKDIGKTEFKGFVKRAINHVLTKHIYTQVSDTAKFEQEIKHELEQYASSFRMFLPVEGVKLTSVEPFELHVRVLYDVEFIDIIVTINMEENESSINK